MAAAVLPAIRMTHKPDLGRSEFCMYASRLWPWIGHGHLRFFHFARKVDEDPAAPRTGRKNSR